MIWVAGGTQITGGFVEHEIEGGFVLEGDAAMDDVVEFVDEVLAVGDGFSADGDFAGGEGLADFAFSLPEFSLEEAGEFHCLWGDVFEFFLSMNICAGRPNEQAGPAYARGYGLAGCLCSPASHSVRGSF